MDRSSGKRKRKDVRVVDESVTRKRKKTKKNVDFVDETVEIVDHTEQLPEPVIHNILSFCSTKDAARTSILSKRWKSLWLSYSGLEFDERKFHKYVLRKKARENLRGNERTMFMDFVEQSIQAHFSQKSCIQKLALRISSYDSELASRMNKWIGLAVQNNVPELDLRLSVGEKWRFSLPEVVLASASITALRLHSCKWKANIQLPNLKRLCLRKLHISEQKIESLMVSCPSIEDMRFIKCYGLRSLQVSSHKLDRVEVYLCPGLKNIVVDSKNLRTFWFSGKKSEPHKINLTAIDSLKVLSLQDPWMTDTSFQNYFSGFPFLEKLEISNCVLLKNIMISSVYLKKLVMRDCTSLVSADIDTPNLVYFEFKGDNMPFSLNPFSLEEARLSIHLTEQVQENDTSCFDKVREFLKKFNSSGGLKLATDSLKEPKSCFIHEDFTEILLPRYKYLDIIVFKPSTSMEDLLDRVLEMWQPRFLNVLSPYDSKFPTEIEEMIWECKDPSCSKYERNRGWRSKFSGARNMDRYSGNLRTFPGAYSSEERQLTCFKLFWDCGRSRKKKKA